MAEAPASQPSSLFSSTSLALDSGDHPDDRTKVIRASLNNLSEFLADKASLAARNNKRDDEYDTFWLPTASRIATLIVDWNAAVATLGKEHLKCKSTTLPCDKPHFPPACDKAHNPACNRVHNAPCTRPHSDSPTKSATTTGPTSALNPISNAAFSQVAAHKNITREHIDIANDIRSKVDVSDAVALRLATEQAERTKTQPPVRSAPKGANKTIFVPIGHLSDETYAKIPAAGVFADAFIAKRTNLTDEDLIRAWCTTEHGDMFDESVTCDQTHDFIIPQLKHITITRASLQYMFEGAIPAEHVSSLQPFMTNLCKDVTQQILNPIDRNGSNLIVAHAFHFKSSVVFSNIVPTSFDQAKFKDSLYDSPIWGGVTITRVHFWKTATSDTGIVFVDFHDDKHSTHAKRITRNLTRIGTEFLPCRITRQSSAARSAPQCQKCLRWGHLTNACQAFSSHCNTCGGNHASINHGTYGGDAPLKCFNCGGKHTADSEQCKFFAKRDDRKWLFDNQPRFNRTKGTWVYFNSRKTGEANSTTAT